MNLENFPRPPSGNLEKPKPIELLNQNIESDDDIFEFYTGDGTPEDRNKYRDMIYRISGMKTDVVQGVSEPNEPVPGEPKAFQE